MQKIAFIGAGNMSRAIIGGLIANAGIPASQIYFSDLSQDALAGFKRDFAGINTSTDSADVASQADVVILAVKPHIVCPVINQIKESLNERALVVSIAAGLAISVMEETFAKPVKLIRCMPNTPALVGEGMSVLCGNAHVTSEELAQVVELFNSFGEAEVMPEKLFDAVTGISGSGPAYVFMFMEALADGGVLEGMPRAQAYKLAAQTVLGSAKMLLETGKHPGELKDMVTSPGGTTIEAVTSLENDGLRPAVINAVRTCTEKSRNLGK